MRFSTVALLTGATAAAAGNTATLLLPGFKGQDLEASVIETVRSGFSCAINALFNPSTFD